MSYQPKDQDTMLVRVSENHFELLKYSAKQGEWVERYHTDDPAVMADIAEEFASGKGGDFHPVPVAYDQSGNPIYRLKKYM